MSEIVIRVEGLGKVYRLGSTARNRDLRDTVADAFNAPFRSFQKKDLVRKEAETFWALKDISFEVKKGDVMGIIGRNGAGKSTLLKILSRITEPTEGKVEIRGRVASLLEVGTGFHPELSGRENIFLNGAILGMRMSEIARKFDEIVAFAEVEKFVDTAVKHYSSGMYMRLAFAVAAHLEPEILIIDEVLAVGDAAFQRKCLGKMKDVSQQGRTVLFVSHNINAVLQLCQKSLLLESGILVADERTETVVNLYLRQTAALGQLPLSDRKDRQGNQSLKFTAFHLQDQTGQPIESATTGESVTLAFSYESPNGRPLKDVNVAVGIHGVLDENIFHLSTRVCLTDLERTPPKGILLCKIPSLPLIPGKYSFSLFATVGKEVADWIQNAAAFDVQEGRFHPGGLPPSGQGYVLIEHGWALDEILVPSL